jgi:hypothetical protein
VLTLAGVIRVRLRRYRCPACGQWSAPGAAALDLRPQQRMTRTVEGLAYAFLLSLLDKSMELLRGWLLR